MFFFLSCTQNRAVAYTGFLSRKFLEVARNNCGHRQHYSQFCPSKLAAQKLTGLVKTILKKNIMYNNYIRLIKRL